MIFKLETPEHQRTAIQSVVEVFRGMEKNTYDNATNEDIRANYCSLSLDALMANINKITFENGIDPLQSYLQETRNACIEMETGTGKTLTYLQTAYELFNEYGLTKFIVLVPSIPIRQGAIDTFENFKVQLEDKYGFTPNVFVYDSSKLSDLRDFITAETPQIMIMTMASFNSEDKILNQEVREDLFNNKPFIEAIASTHPIIFMDEPQEGMDTENSQLWLSKLSPLFKFRYSATHAVKVNMLYQLTPSESYRLGLVKKIEVLTVTEKNDEATLKIEINEVQETKTEPKVKLKFWKFNKTKENFVFKDSNFLKKGDNLAEKSGNDTYSDFTISRIYKKMSTRKWVVEFTNGASIEEGTSSANKEQVWALQLEWLIRRHFENQQRLKPKGIKNLSLIFIDKVANYMSPENPVIKKIFEQQYKTVYAEFHNGQVPSDEQVTAVQGFYFAKTSTGEFTDNEKTNKSNKEIYDEILHNKQKLLSFGSTIEFVFSHSALGVGWDNPNVFGIATLNESYSENKKRQEIGRGLRICVNQQGERVYDAEGTPDDEVINQLTVVPNETYETFARSYQNENEKAFGKSGTGAKLKHTHKGKHQNRVTFKLNKDEGVQSVFRRFWNTIAKKTTYRVSFNEDAIIRRSIEELNTISIADYIAEVSMYHVRDIEDLSQREYIGSDDPRHLQASFSPHDLIEDLSEKTGLCYNSVMRIVSEIDTKKEYLKNPPVFLENAAFKIRQIQLDELTRCITYTPTGETYDFDFADFTKDACDNYVSTPNHGIWDKTLYDSKYEHDFALEADNDTKHPEIVCFLKFPSWYRIPMPQPIGNYYEPDFGVVLKRKSLKENQRTKEYYFVIEIKGTNDLSDQRALTPHEVARIKCAVEHFRSLGIEAVYKAPIREYSKFEEEASKTINPEI
ncbi:MAG: DEAD/DEAH box helicase family protein [Prevotella sp.]|nr:DEAD/DEAH box helicase family protein [Prevotella sp.]